ncbi:hypothetical protein PENTCL1PPCAC_8383, partial [Pristionchus entomophagus]
TLGFTEKKVLRDISVYHLDDGTVFYHQLSCFPARLYVKCRGKEIEAKLPIYCGSPTIIRDQSGKSIFLLCDNEIFCATFSAGLINITFLREFMTTATHKINYRGWCRQVRNGKDYVYRVQDHPIDDAIVVDDLAYSGVKPLILGVHR